ncbi:MAG: TraR/DksA C4-type zinc finger protein [Gemmatimonadota bacterium]|nr:TraR/DksA C4-type zinc finger protein [Gemmatimonadota bacterium]
MTDLDRIRSELEEKLREMTDRHARLSAHLRNEDREMPADWQEMAQFVENDEVLESLEARTRERLEAIVRAVGRIDEGSYTICARCGGEIQGERLELLPTTTICSSCA